VKTNFNMFDPDCPVCDTSVCIPNDFTYTIINT
jgi:hypothetical protein